jgi:DNA-binding PadR family transcriptional regulator
MTSMCATIPGPRYFGHGPGFHKMKGRGRHGRPHYGPWGRGFGPGPGPGRKAGRGDIRAAILALLAEQPMHGYQIIREITERSEGAWHPSPGSVYPTLQQLADEGLVKTEESEGRRVHELTDEGRTQAEAHAGTLPWEDAAEEADDDLVNLRDLAFGTMAAVRQVAQAGSTAHVEAAQAILRETRKQLYRLLADDETPDEK